MAWKTWARVRAAKLVAGALVLALLSMVSPTGADAIAVGDGSFDVGDVNCSTSTNLVDALLIAGYSVGAVDGANACPAPGSAAIDLSLADVNFDGQINVLDALQIALCQVGAIPAPCFVNPAILSNDELVNATEVFPSETGFEIAEPFDGVATIAADEGDGDDCVESWHDDGSLWYRFEATSSQLGVLESNDDQYLGVYRAAPGVVNPTSTSDLEMIACSQIQFHGGAILQPGETYWISNSGYWEQPFWLFDGDPQCIPGGGPCPDEVNDHLIQATAIDMQGTDPVEIPATDVVPTLAPGEAGEPCIGLDTTTLWYRLDAPSEFLTVTAGLDARGFSLYEAPAGVGYVSQVDQLNHVSCIEHWLPYAETVPGTTYYLAVFHNDGFTLSGFATMPASHDELANALEVVPTADGLSIAEPYPELHVTIADDEVDDNDCVHPSFTGGSLWYKVVATTTELNFLGSNDDQHIGVYRALPGVANPTTTDDLEMIGCEQLRGNQVFPNVVEVGETYWISNSGYWEQEFWIYNGPV